MSSKYRGFDKESNKGQNYSSGAWGSGDLDAGALAKKYGLDTSNQGRGEGHIWGTNRDGSEVYIGKSNMGMATNADLISAHSSQAHAEEVDHSSVPDNLSSLGDIKGAILNQWSGGAAAAETTKPVEEKKIVLSETVAEAVAGKKAYENQFLPRQGDYTILGDESVREDFNNAFALNLAEARKPQVARDLGADREMPVQSQSQAQSLRQSDPAALNFANNFKLSVADTLRSSPNPNARNYFNL